MLCIGFFFPIIRRVRCFEVMTERYLQDNSWSLVSIAIQLLVRPLHRAGWTTPEWRCVWQLGDLCVCPCTCSCRRRRQSHGVFDNRQWVVKRSTSDTRQCIAHCPVNWPLPVRSGAACTCPALPGRPVNTVRWSSATSYTRVNYTGLALFDSSSLGHLPDEA